MTPSPPLCAFAPGKVNLGLFVGAPRADGLHPLVSIVQPLSLADELCLAPAPAGVERDEVHCPEVDGLNLAAEALAAYRGATGWDAPAQRLTIAKRVPVAAGMGGGSGDAAAALRLAAHAAGRPDDPVLHELAPGLGADVPAQVEPARSLVTGAGEDVEPLPDFEPFGVLVLPSRDRLSTPAVFAQVDRMGLERSAEELRGLRAALRAAAQSPPAALLHNDLEAAACVLSPSIAAALATARAAGADHAMVSGSGPTVVGLFMGQQGPARARVAAAAVALAAAGSGRPRALAAEPVGPAFARPHLPAARSGAVSSLRQNPRR